MTTKYLTNEHVSEFLVYLKGEERADATIEKYRLALDRFVRSLAGEELTREKVIAYKGRLLEGGASAASVNATLSAINGCLKFVGRSDCRVRQVKRQNSAYLEPGRELDRSDYEKLRAAAARNRRVQLLIETLAGCGIRVGELRFFTVEAARRGEVNVNLKGKLRRILIPGKLSEKLLAYAADNNITSGMIFITRTNRPLDRRSVWASLKRICKKAGIEQSKVFPHNLRHLFAVEHYREYHDIAILADILGHSSLNTTRIYLKSTGEEHRRQLEQLNLIE